MAWSKPWGDNTSSSSQYTYVNIYTKDEIDNLLNEGDWKKSVETFEDIKTTYPTPEKGWVVPVDSTQVIYRYNGTDWMALFGNSNSIELVTPTTNGLMRAVDKKKFDELVSSAPEVLDTLKEIADSLGNDPNFSQTVDNKLLVINEKQGNLLDLSTENKTSLVGSINEVSQKNTETLKSINNIEKSLYNNIFNMINVDVTTTTSSWSTYSQGLLLEPKTDMVFKGFDISYGKVKVDIPENTDPSLTYSIYELDSQTNLPLFKILSNTFKISNGTIVTSKVMSYEIDVLLKKNKKYAIIASTSTIFVYYKKVESSTTAGNHLGEYIDVFSRYDLNNGTVDLSYAYWMIRNLKFDISKSLLIDKSVNTANIEIYKELPIVDEQNKLFLLI